MTPCAAVRCLVVVAALPLVAAPSATQPSTDAASLAVTIPVTPMAVRMDGRRWLVGEIRLANRSTTPLALRRVRISSSSRVAIADVAGESLVRHLDHAADADGVMVAPGAVRVLYVDAPVDSDTAALDTIDVDVQAAAGDAPVGTGVHGVRVDPRPPVVVGAPLTGGPWAAVHHPDWDRGHRRVYVTVDGVARVPGRFTIDFVRLDDAGRTTRGDPDRVAAALGYGAPVLAVADAVVALTRDDMAEPPRISARVRHAPPDAAGNFVSLDLGAGRFAVYEHLQPGSLRVRAGQRVHRGETIARLGFTGDSTGPHLHLHVGDAASPPAAEGLPFVLERFTVLGRYADIATLGSARWTRDGAGERQRERPAPNVVVTFRR